jgi:hypothetical protein
MYGYLEKVNFKKKTVSKAEATEVVKDYPIEGFPMVYEFHTGPWKMIFDQQIELIQRDILRATAEGKLIVYLSCPISSRGGGYSVTNVDVAKHIERHLLEVWGEGFWILNPSQYQLESKAGMGLMTKHANDLGIDLPELLQFSKPIGGDYMRMWTTVLVKNDTQVGTRHVEASYVNSGQYFDAFYFIGPKDAQSFFTDSGETLTAGIQEYFSRKFAIDSDFRDHFSIPGIKWQALLPGEVLSENQKKLRNEWENMRSDFFRYYALKASVNFSLGSHDEWLIFKTLNAIRREKSNGDVGVQIAGYFDGGQIDPASSELPLSPGYSQGGSS